MNEWMLYNMNLNANLIEQMVIWVEQFCIHVWQSLINKWAKLIDTIGWLASRWNRLVYTHLLSS